MGDENHGGGGWQKGGVNIRNESAKSAEQLQETLGLKAK
jgi:hypothetical protein